MYKIIAKDILSIGNDNGVLSKPKPKDLNLFSLYEYINIGFI